MGDDHRAFLDATLPHVDVVYQVARHAVGAGQEPEDLVQETYLRAYAAFGSYRGQNVRAWLAAICLKWRLGGTEAVVAVSSRPFPMPPGAQGAPGGGMAWSARVGKLGLYCINGMTSELVAAPVPVAELPGLAARLPLA